MNNHCWSPDAQRSGLYSFEDALSEAEEQLDENAETLRFDTTRKAIRKKVVNLNTSPNCIDCANFACNHLVHMNSQASSRGGLTEQDLHNIARTCVEYTPK
jgi:hypothetical protein